MGETEIVSRAHTTPLGLVESVNCTRMPRVPGDAYAYTLFFLFRLRIIFNYVGFK